MRVPREVRSRVPRRRVHAVRDVRVIAGGVAEDARLPKNRNGRAAAREGGGSRWHERGRRVATNVHDRPEGGRAAPGEQRWGSPGASRQEMGGNPRGREAWEASAGDVLVRGGLGAHRGGGGGGDDSGGGAPHRTRVEGRMRPLPRSDQRVEAIRGMASLGDGPRGEAEEGEESDAPNFHVPPGRMEWWGWQEPRAGPLHVEARHIGPEKPLPCHPRAGQHVGG